MQLQILIPSIGHRLIFQAIIMRVDLPVDIVTSNADFFLVEERILMLWDAFFYVMQVDLDEDGEGY